ncbi:MAG: HEPN domain-containing protein [Chloroflexi bacterium]|nr:HEPN domain-containing protein [Chloroflexota bacterium]
MTRRQIEQEFAAKATRKYLRDWITSAEDFYRVAHRDLAKTNLYGATCFYARQCADFYLKAFLIQHDVELKITWNLPTLNRLCAKIEPSFKDIAIFAKRLAPFDEKVLYPGFSATQADAKDCVTAMREIRKCVRARLGLK